MSLWPSLDSLLDLGWACPHMAPSPCTWAHLRPLLQVQATPPPTCPHAQPAGHAPVETVAEMLERAAHDLGNVAGVQAPAIPPKPSQQQTPLAPSRPPGIGLTGPASSGQGCGLHLHREGPQAVHTRLSQQAQQVPLGVRPTPAPHSTAVPLRPAPRSTPQQLTGAVPSSLPPSAQRERPSSTSEPPLVVCAAGPQAAHVALEASDSRKRSASEAALDQAEPLAKRLGLHRVCSQSLWDPPGGVQPRPHIPPQHLGPPPLSRPAEPHAVLEALEVPDSTRQRRQSSQQVQLRAGADGPPAQGPVPGW